MSLRMSRLLLILAFLIVSPFAYGYDQTQEECEDGLSSGFQARFLGKDLDSLRAHVAQEIRALEPVPESDFWLNTLLILKREQAGYSTVYFLPQGDQSLTEEEKTRLFAAHQKKDKFHRPANETEWRQFYWNHLQGKIRFAAKLFKRAYVLSIDPELEAKADRAFDAVIMPTVIEDCGLDEARIRQEIALVTKEALRSSQTERRLQIKALGPKMCCKTPGGCHDCFHNRRHLKSNGE